MAYVVTEHCVDCKYTDCVAVCPVDAFHQGPRMLYINPETCVNCDACVPACPVEAIFAEENLPDKFEYFIGLNEKKSQEYPIVNEQQDPLPGAKSLEDWEQSDQKGGHPEGFPPQD